MLSNQWTETNTPMNQKRVKHACAMIDDDRIIVIGGWGENYKRLKTTEILNIKTRQWQSGPSLPTGLADGQFVTASPGFKYLGYYVGGSGYDGHSFFIYGLTRDLNEFKVLGNIKIERSDHVAIQLAASISDKCAH